MKDKKLEQLAKETIRNSLWRATPITQTPSIALSRWSIWETGGQLYFVGYNETEREGRVSSAIREFDIATMRGRTDSGRIYQLIGEFGHDPDGIYVWSIMLANSKIADARDVTNDVVSSVAGPDRTS
jgi:hypothetical protein